MLTLYPQNEPRRAPLSLSQKYRPSRIAELQAQPRAQSVLQSFLASPYSAAFIFHGPTGTGKTSAGYALAAELRIDTDFALYEIAAGKQLSEDVERVIDRASRRMLVRAGYSDWRMVLVNEADRMPEKVEHLWLDPLDMPPENIVFVFTSNKIDRFTERFKGRCLPVDFTQDHGEARRALEKHIAEIWKKETGRAVAPTLKHLGMEDGAIDFRAALQRLQPFVNRALEQNRAAKSA